MPLPFTVGEVAKSSDLNLLPFGNLGYAQVTANQTGITTPANLTGLTVTVTVTAGKRIRITGSVIVSSTVGTDVAQLAIQEGGTVLQQSNVVAGGGLSIISQVVLTPTAGSHTYKLTMNRNAGTGSLTMVAGSTFPAFILVEDIGT